MGIEEEDIAVSGGSGWEDFGTDEARHALEIYHQHEALFEDADSEEESSAAASDHTPIKDNRRSSSANGEETKKWFLRGGSNKSGGGRPWLGYCGGHHRISMCHIDGRTWCKCLIGMAIIALIVTGIIFLTTDAPKQFRRWKVKHNFLLIDPSLAQAESLIPSRYSTLSNVGESSSSDGTRTTPLLWDIPGDGNVYERVLTKCLGFVAAGGAVGDSRQSEVASHEPLQVFGQNENRFVNVWLGSEDGIERGKRQDLVGSGTADVIYTPLVYESTVLFSPTHKGKLFALFHNPVDRVASVWKGAKEYYSHMSDWTLQDFLEAYPVNDNWMTREISGGQAGIVNEEQFQIAREVIRAKCLVGLSTHSSDSIDRALSYFGWKDGVDMDAFQECANGIELDEGSDKLYFGLFEKGSADWNTTIQHNYYDLRLYEFIQMLYAEQLNAGITPSNVEASTSDSKIQSFSYCGLSNIFPILWTSFAVLCMLYAADFEWIR